MRISLSPLKNETQWRVNDVWSSIFDNERSVQLYDAVIIVLGAFINKIVSNNITSAS